MAKKSRRGETRIKTKYNTISYKDGDFFEVEDIKDKRINSTGKAEYFVKWIGWPEETNTWEPISNLKNVMHLIVNYEQKSSLENGIEFVEPQFSDEDSEDSHFSDIEGNISVDKPLRILKMFKEEDNSIKVEIEWMVRKKTGSKPLNSVLDRDLLKKNYLLMLIDFYESKFRFPKD